MGKVRKILYINNFFSDYGGTEKTMYNEALLLRKAGIETYFFAVDKKPYLEEECFYSEYFPKFINYRELSRLSTCLNFFRPFYNFEAENKLDKLLKQVKPDLVRCCNIYYHLTPSVLRVCEKNNVPVAMSIHDCRLFCPSGGLMLGNSKFCEDLLCINKNPAYCIKNLCKNNKLLPSFIVSFEHIFNKTFKFYKKVNSYICQSEAMLKLAVKAGINKNNLFLLNTYLLDSYFESPPEYENNIYFLFAGRISKEKGIDTLINAAKIVPEIPIHIVGTGSEENDCKKLVQENNLYNVKFIGYKYSHELEKEYKNCIATILPCNWFENFPRSVLESFAFGKPAIASRIGGIPEIIDDGVNGYTIEPGNYKLLAEYMKKLFFNKKLARELGENARKKAKAKYNSEIYLKKVLEIYNSTIN